MSFSSITSATDIARSRATDEDSRRCVLTRFCFRRAGFISRVASNKQRIPLSPSHSSPYPSSPAPSTRRARQWTCPTRQTHNSKTNSNTRMQPVNIGNIDLRELADVLPEAARVERHVINEVRIAADCLLLTSSSIPHVVSVVAEDVASRRSDHRLVIRVQQADGELDVAAVSPKRDNYDWWRETR